MGFRPSAILSRLPRLCPIALAAVAHWPLRCGHGLVPDKTVVRRRQIHRRFCSQGERLHLAVGQRTTDSCLFWPCWTQNPNGRSVPRASVSKAEDLTLLDPLPAHGTEAVPLLVSRLHRFANAHTVAVLSVFAAALTLSFAAARISECLSQH